MLEKPDLADEKILVCLQTEYEIPAAEVFFLPLGADQNTAVYRAVTADAASYFVKLRRGAFDETAVALPRFLSDQGIRQIIASLQTRSGQLWAQVEAYRLVLSPFIEGHNGYESPPSDRHWMELGAALRNIHALKVPEDLSGRIRREDFSSRWRDGVLSFLGKIENEVYAEPVALELAAYLKARRSLVLDLVERTERLAGLLQTSSPELVLCHSDIHAGNLLIDAHSRIYIVDWDEPVFAPKERDLMCAGSGLMGGWRTPHQEEALFYQGYGTVQADQNALAYYRYERIIMDIAAFCEQLLLSDEGGADREQALVYLKSNFEPDGTIAIASRADRSGVIG